VQQVIARLRELGAVSVRHMSGVSEDVHFPLPRGLGDRNRTAYWCPRCQVPGPPGAPV
jgi:4-hydroxy-3-methylbut-2-enyl diphosphate reductase